MEIRQFVYGKFQARDPEYDIRLVDSRFNPNYKHDEYKEIKDYIIHSFNHVFYGLSPYSFNTLPELVTWFNNKYLFIKFFPPFDDQRDTTAMVESLCHCLIFSESELKAINYNLWEVRDKFIRNYEKAAIIGNDNTVWLTQQEAVALGRKAKVVQIDIRGDARSTVDSLTISEKFPNYYAILTDHPETVFNDLAPSRRLGIFANGLLLNGTPELLTKLANKDLHFVLLSKSYENRIASQFIPLDTADLGTLAPIPKPEKTKTNNVGQEYRQMTESPERNLVNPDQKIPVNPDQKIPVNPNPSYPQYQDAREGGPRFPEPSPLKPHEIDQLKSISAQSILIDDLSAELKNTNQFVYFCFRNRFNVPYLIEIEKEDAPGSSFNMNYHNVEVSPQRSKEIVDREVELGRKYKYTVRLKKNAYQHEEYKAIGQLEVVMPPNPVTTIESNYLKESNKTQIKWLAPDNNLEVEYLIFRYTVDESNNRIEEFRKRLAGNETSYIDNDLPADQKILYTITVIDKLYKNASEPCETEEILLLPPLSKALIIPPETPPQIRKERPVLYYLLAGLVLVTAGLGAYVILKETHGGSSTVAAEKKSGTSASTSVKEVVTNPDSSTSSIVAAPITESLISSPSSSEIGTIGIKEKREVKFPKKVNYVKITENGKIKYHLTWKWPEGEGNEIYHYIICRNTDVIMPNHPNNAYVDEPKLKSGTLTYTVQILNNRNDLLKSIKSDEIHLTNPHDRPSIDPAPHNKKDTLEPVIIKIEEIKRKPKVDSNKSFPQKVVDYIIKPFKKSTDN